MTGRNLGTRARRFGCAAAGEDKPTDADLVGSFVAARDPAAFEVLVRRHGPMVLGVCRRVLGRGPDAEDAFQATFLVLVRRADALARPSLIANWLYGVALRVARKARVLVRRRCDRERPITDMPSPDHNHPTAWRDLRDALDEELNRLPDNCRAPVVLCHLEGRTLDAAARQLGWPKGTVAGRLSRARDLLRRRLSRRGVAFGLLTFDLACSERASAAVPERLVSATVAGAVRPETGLYLPSQAKALADDAVRDAARQSTASAILAALHLLGAGGLRLLGVAAGEALWDAYHGCQRGGAPVATCP
jgi:RNA polymerase sigma-70 factor (ECF subfamily)